MESDDRSRPGSLMLSQAGEEVHGLNAGDDGVGR